MQHDIPILDKTGLRHFGLTTAAILAGLFGLLLPWLLELNYPRWPWVVAIILGAWALIYPASLNPVYKTWMHFGLFMGAIMNKVVLGAVFFFVITPLGLLMRLFGYNPMRDGHEGGNASYWKKSRRTPPKNMEKPF